MDLSPDWVVGFIDGEGCFAVHITQNPKSETEYQVLPEFIVTLPKRDIQVLYALKRFFRFGVVRPHYNDRYAYRVSDLKGLRQICDFFFRHPLKTKKRVDFLRFHRVLAMMERNKHLSLDGLEEIIRITLKMDTGNRPQLQQALVKLQAKRRVG